LAVNKVAVATPPPALFTGALLANVPEAPVPGAVKVTGVATVTGLPKVSSTVAVSVVKAPPTVTLWPAPVVVTTLLAVPARIVKFGLAAGVVSDDVLTLIE
jgi:hypothetical protein